MTEKKKGHEKEPVRCIFEKIGCSEAGTHRMQVENGQDFWLCEEHHKSMMSDAAEELRERSPGLFEAS